MRKILSLVAVLALSACGGGGGGSAPQAPQPPPAPTSAPQSGMVTPQFTIVIPARQGSSTGRKPQFISSTTLSVKIALTADSAGITPGTLPNNPAITNVNGGGAQPSCTAGCTVNGPPSPPGTDSFTITTYNAANAAGSALDTGTTGPVTVNVGQANPITVWLGGIPVSFVINSVPAGAGAFHAGTATQSTTLTVTAKDADGNTITADANNTPYAFPVTLTDPDTNVRGSCLSASASTCSTASLTTATFNKPGDTATFRYDGLAENPVTLSATSTAPGAAPGTAPFQPVLNAPAFNSAQATPAPLPAQTAAAEIDLFNTSGLGSTGTESFTESGWTNYGHALLVGTLGTCTVGTGYVATLLAQFAGVSAGSNSTTNGTPFTATESTTNGSGIPSAGSCPVAITDGLTLNTTHAESSLTVTYTDTTGSINAKIRRQK